MGSTTFHSPLSITSLSVRQALYGVGALVLGGMASFSGNVAAHPGHEQTQSGQNNGNANNNVSGISSSEADTVITVTAPAFSSLEVTTSPKAPRQPIPASDGSDLLKSIPGFAQIRNGGSNGDPVLRGMFGSRLNILANGTTMLGACGNRMDAPTSYISPESYDLLTVIKGPQTVLWGPGASAGTVLFERQPENFSQSEVRGDASIMYGSHSRFDKNFDLTAGNSLGYIRATGSESQAQDYKDGNGDPVPSKWKKWNTDIALGWTPDQDTVIELNAGKGNGEARYAGRNMDGAQFLRESLGIRFEKSNLGGVLDKVEAQYYYNYADHVMDNFSLRQPVTMKMQNNVDRRTVGGRAQATWQWQDISLKGGMDGQSNVHRKKTNGAWIQDAGLQNYGLFSELNWETSQQDQVIAGARLDRAIAHDYRATSANIENSRNDILPSGFARYERQLSDIPAMYYLGLGYTERFPDYWELFSPAKGPNGSVNAFQGMKPEKTTQLDVGLQYKDARFNSWVSGYIGQINDFLLFTYDQKQPRQGTNVDARIMGAEMGAGYKLTDHWKVDSSLAYAWGKNTTEGHALPQMPPLDARFIMSYENLGWSSSVLWRVVAKQDRIAINQGNVVGKDFDKSAGFGVLSLNTAYRFNSHLKASAGVDNLFNKAYAEHLNLAGSSGFGYAANTQIMEPGRTLWGKINLTF